MTHDKFNLSGHEPESAERVLGDVAAVADVEDDDVVAVLGHEAHAAVRHSPTAPATVRAQDSSCLTTWLYLNGCQSDLPNVERSQVSCEFGYPPQGLVGQGVDVGEGHELQAAGRNEIMSAYV